MRLYIFIFCTLFSLCSLGQGEANIWYFGFSAGLDFNGDTVAALSDGPININEGCATLCSADGQHLFSTDGIGAYPVSNGAGMLGDPSSSQSAMIAPVPGNNLQFYIFSIDEQGGPDGLNYSIVERDPINGSFTLSEITNEKVAETTCEKIAVIPHYNNEDFWLVMHYYKSNYYGAYLVTPEGVSGTPVFSEGFIDISTQPYHAIGYLKASPSGKWVAAAHFDLNTVELMTFDNRTGKLEKFTYMEGFTDNKPYGLEFSPDEQRLYVAEASLGTNRILQFDLSSKDPDLIPNSRYWINSHKTGGGALQMGPDGKIYCAQNGANSISVIHNPNGLGENCQFDSGSITFQSAKSALGLPSFALTYIPFSDFDVVNNCKNLPTQFVQKSRSYDSVYWDFGDPVSGNLNNSKEAKPTHLYSDTGKYTVTLYTFSRWKKDTVIKTINIAPEPQFDLGPDKIICTDEVLKINLNTFAGTNEWLDNPFPLPPYREIKKGGVYFAQSKQGPCIVTDTIKVEKHPTPYFSLPQDTAICLGDTVKIKLGHPNYKFKWDNGDTLRNRNFATAGTYRVNTELKGCDHSDSIKIEILNIPHLNLGNDTILCPRTQLELRVPPAPKVIWNTGDTSLKIKINSPDTINVTLFNGPCYISDTVVVAFEKDLDLNLGADTVLCYDEELFISLDSLAVEEQIHFIWADGFTQASRRISEAKIYQLNAITPHCSFTDQIEISRKHCSCDEWIPNAFSPNNDGINDVFNPQIMCELEQYSLQIYNRWGEKIFESEEINNPWQGFYQNRLVQAGVYGFIINYTPKEQTSQSTQGTVHLIR